MDRRQEDLPSPNSLVVPKGGRVNAFMHQARTVCRRAEREVLALSRPEPIGEWPVRDVNRLSDAFFVLSCWVARRLAERECLWERGVHARELRMPQPC